jgi:hypothetical protein
VAHASLSANLQVSSYWSVTKSRTGLPALPDTLSPVKKHSYELGAGADACNRIYAALLTIAGGASTTLDLEALTDVFGDALDFARVKAIRIWLLSATDDAPDGTADAGTACSGVTVGNAASNQFAGSGYPISDAATGTFTLANGDQFARATGSAGGWVVDATHKNLKVLNNDGAVAAKVWIEMFGADS